MPEWKDSGKPKTNKPEYVNTPYGPVLKTDLNKGPTLSAQTLKTLQTTPNIPGNTYYIGAKKDPEDNKDLVKVSDLSNYIENYNQSLSEFDLE